MSGVSFQVLAMAGASGGAPFNPTSLFGAAEYGVLNDPSSAAYSDAGVTLAAIDGTVQQLNDLSGNGLHLSQATAGNRPILRDEGSGKRSLEFASGDWLPNGAFSRQTSVVRTWTLAYALKWTAPVSQNWPLMLWRGDATNPGKFTDFWNALRMDAGNVDYEGNVRTDDTDASMPVFQYVVADMPAINTWATLLIEDVVPSVGVTNSCTWKAYVNGVLKFTTNYTQKAGSLEINRFALGGMDWGGTSLTTQSHGYDGRLGRSCYIARALTAQERADLTTWVTM